MIQREITLTDRNQTRSTKTSPRIKTIVHLTTTMVRYALDEYVDGSPMWRSVFLFNESIHLVDNKRKESRGEGNV